MSRQIYTREVVSWGFYDFANSAFATTILSVIFNVYFVKVICGNGVPVGNSVIPGESFWGYIISFSTFVVFLFTPVLGAIADFSALKKKFLLFFCSLGCIFTGMLYLCVEGNYWLAALFFIFANIGFSAGNAFYNALLQDISTPHTIGRVSGFGWALGYIGGALLLVLNLAFIRYPGFFHITTGNHLPERISLFSVAVWWALFSLPLFLFVREKSGAAIKIPERGYVRRGIDDVRATFGKIKEHKEIFKYLIAFLFYNDGIETLIVMASIFGAKALGMTETNLIVCFLMIQVVAFFGALIFGYAADRVGHKNSITVTLWIYMAVCLWAVVMKTEREFWILGAVVGLVLGGSQSASRSLLGLLNPKENSAQFFGFFALTGKLSSVIGAFAFGLLSQIYSLRVAIAGLLFFFAVGLAILHFVNEPETRRPVSV